MTRRAVISLAGFGFLAFLPDGAAAAAPDYCALYAREQARLTAGTDTAEALQREQDKAFYQCLNMDEDPPLPDASAYADEPLGSATDTAEGDAAVDDETPVTPVVKPQTVKTAAARGKYHGSGLKPWTPEWKAWCQEHFPNSFDPKTGTVLPIGGKRTLCP